APAYYGRGQVLYREGKLDEAIENFRTAIHFAPGYSEAHYRLGVALEKKAMEAQKRFETSKDPADATEFQKDFLAAIDSLRNALAANNDYAEAHTELGLRLLDLHQLDEATWNLHEAVRINPDSAEAWTNLGGALFQSGKSSDAADAFQHALMIKP